MTDTFYCVTFNGRYAHEVHPFYPGAHPDGYVTILAASFDGARVAAAKLFGTGGYRLSTTHPLLNRQPDPALDVRPYPRGQLGYFTEDDAERIAQSRDWATVTAKIASPNDPDRPPISFRDDRIAGVVSTRALVHGMTANGFASVAHPHLMNQAELRDLAGVVRDLLTPDPR